MKRLAQLVLAFSSFFLTGTSVLAQQPPDCYTCASCTAAAGITAVVRSVPTGIACGTGLQNWGAVLGTNNYIQFTIGPTQINNIYTFSVCNSGSADNTVMYIMNNIPPISTIFACDDDGCGNVNGLSQLTTRLNAGTYRLYVFRNGCNIARTAAIQVQVACVVPPAPTNDDPCGAIPLPIAGNTCNFVNATSFGATNSGTGTTPPYASPSPNPSCFGAFATGNFVGGDVWFRVTVPPSGRFALETEEPNLCAGAIQLVRNPGGCTSSTTFSHLYPTTPQYGCVLQGPTGPGAVPAGVFSGLTPGETVFIRYFERNHNEPGGFRICAYEPDPAPGDNACQAVPLLTPNTCNFQGFALDRTGPMAGFATNPVQPSAACGGPALYDMWFRVVLTPNMLTFGLNVNTEAAGLTDMSMAWYRRTVGNVCNPATSPSLIQVSCNANQSATNLMPRIVTNAFGSSPAPAVAGDTLYIRVWASQWGTFSICAQELAPPVNDNPCGAILLPTTFGGCNPIATTNAVATETIAPLPGVTSITAPTCGGTPNGDVWYRVVVAPNGQVRILADPQVLNNAAMQLYQSTGSCSTGNLALTALGVANTCRTNGNPAATAMPFIDVNLNPLVWANDTLYLRVWRDDTTPEFGAFNLCSYRTDAPNATCPDVSTDSGGPNGNYSNGENFVQTFCPSGPGLSVNLSFTAFNTEPDLDVLTVFDGADVNAPCLGRFSGASLPPQITGSSPGGCITVRFTSNASGTRPGWRANVSCVPAVPEVQCGTPVFDPVGLRCGNYLNSQNVAQGPYCAPNATEVATITFSEFNLAELDYLTIYDGNSTLAPCLGQFSGNALPPSISGTVPGGCITLGFTSNDNTTAAGYAATVTYGPPPPPPPPLLPLTASGTVNTCNARVTDSGGPCGLYADNQDFEVTYCPPPGQFVTIQFTHFETEAGWDQLFLYNGPNSSFPKIASTNGIGFGPAAAFGPGGWWGINAPPVVTSTHPSGCITLRWRSDDSVVRTGWQAVVSCTSTPPPPPPPPVGVCGTVVADMGGPSGNYINNSGNATPQSGTPQPLWTATYCPDGSLPPGSTVTLEFLTFRTEANYDALYIYNSNTVDPGALISSGNPAPTFIPGFFGNQLLGPGGFWGASLPPTVTSTHPSGCITLAFTSDELVTFAGWTALVTCNQPPPPPPPPSDCVYVLRLYDQCGDGWRGSNVQLSVNGGPLTTYTLTNGSFAQFFIPVDIGDSVVLLYNGTGPNSGDNSYTFGPSDSPFASFYSGSPIAPLPVAITVDCEDPPAPPEDCVGAITLCSNATFNGTTTHTGSFADLNSTNRGCLAANERQGIWYVFSSQTAGNLGFTLTPINPADDYNFAVWGPYPAGSITSTVCPVVGPPVRCSYATSLGTTGMAGGTTPGFALPAPAVNEGPGGSRWTPGLTVAADQVWLLYVSNASGSGQGVNLAWNLQAGADLSCTILPVELLTFDAVPQAEHVDVLWTTVSEENSDHFRVQRSVDGERFVDLGRVAAMGISQQRVDYRFKDSAPVEGLSYYRLEQVDRDGTSTLSQVVPVWYRSAPRALEVFPNPAVDRLRVQFDAMYDGEVRWRITDASGRTALTSNFGVAKGRNGFDIDVAALDRGTYLIQLFDEQGGTIGTARFVKS